jgi:hypothetical protein
MSDIAYSCMKKDLLAQLLDANYDFQETDDHIVVYVSIDLKSILDEHAEGHHKGPTLYQRILTLFRSTSGPFEMNWEYGSGAGFMEFIESMGWNCKLIGEWLRENASYTHLTTNFSETIRKVFQAAESNKDVGEISDYLKKLKNLGTTNLDSATVPSKTSWWRQIESAIDDTLERFSREVVMLMLANGVQDVVKTLDFTDVVITGYDDVFEVKIEVTDESFGAENSKRWEGIFERLNFRGK